MHEKYPFEKSVYSLFHRIATEHADEVAYRFKRGGRWHDVTWRQQYERVADIAKALMALGVKKGDRVNILSQTRLEWIQCDFGISAAGAVTVGIYPSNLPTDCAYIINHCEAVAIFVENEPQLEKILSRRGRLKSLRHIVMFDTPARREEGVISWEAFLQHAASIDEPAFAGRRDKVVPNDLAAIVYTSGTTGTPKGAMLSHENLTFTSWSATQSLYLERGVVNLLFLPLAHVFARIITYASMRAAVTLAIAESLEKVAENIREIRPHFFASVPRVYEKIHERIQSEVMDAPRLKKKIFDWALSVGYATSDRRLAGEKVQPALSLKYALAQALVFKKIRAAFGGRIMYTISGAAPLNVEIARFFHACGVLILEGLGMTENTSFTNVNRLDQNKFGTVGPPGPGIEQKIAGDGEILFRGKNVMLGYYKDPKATRKAIDAEGWLHTGDIGEIDDDNFLRITDRKKELIVTAGGKNVSPQRVERILRTSRYISQVVAFGDRQKFLTALLTLNQQEVAGWAASRGLPTDDWNLLIRRPEIIALIGSEVAAGNRKLATYETIKAFRIVDREFTVETGELTPSLKLKRRVIKNNYDALLEEMYRETAAA